MPSAILLVRLPPADCLVVLECLEAVNSSLKAEHGGTVGGILNVLGDERDGKCAAGKVGITKVI